MTKERGRYAGNIVWKTLTANVAVMAVVAETCKERSLAALGKELPAEMWRKRNRVAERKPPLYGDVAERGKSWGDSANGIK